MSHDSHAHPASASASAATTWTEPPWSGWIETTGDALLILEAARRGLIPRVTRRLVDSERKMITSGSVFVFDEDESGIKRWTDGFFWSPSRILGNFLLYRETEKRGAGHRSARQEQAPPETSEPQFASAEGPAGGGGVKVEGSQTLSRPKSESSKLNIDRQRERSLVGSLTNSYKFKQGGMMKKTFSLTIGGVAQHLISYYKIEDVEQGRLRSPSTLPELAALDISPEYLDKTHFRNPPKVEIGVDGIPRYRGEADDIDGSPQMLSAPLAAGMPLYGEEGSSPSSSKRSKRYDPYSGNAPKRSRKSKNAAATAHEAAAEVAPVQQPQPGYPDAGVAPMPPYPPYSYYPVQGYPMYSPGPYGGAPAVPSPLPQHTPSPPAAYSYPPVSVDPPSAQYQYYPAPHGYATYSPVAWPHYSGYPPQPVTAAAPGSSPEHGIGLDDEGQDVGDGSA